ncbi:MAG: radical SAM protein [Deltaproteobacteria bacterium]|nr:MAG: radical SAM protein [Deltaproteobacteria bacterium]
MTSPLKKYVFGPVRSRRLGRSLGVDLVTAKTCTFDCVYCEAGRTTDLTLDRRAYVPTEAVIAEIASVLSTDIPLDVVTFSGAGEPTLHAEIGDVISAIHALRPDLRVVVLTNGSLMGSAQVRRSLMNADQVKISVDAIGPDAVARINRPHPDLDWEQALEGIRLFCGTFGGDVSMEVFIVPGINDTQDELKKIADYLKPLQIAEVQINTLDRPGVESWVHQLDARRLEEIRAFLGDLAGIIGAPVNTVASRGPVCLSGLTSADVLEMIRRRPCTAEDISKTTGVSEGRVKQVLGALVAASVAQCEKQVRGTFYFTRC